jgi:nicotinamide mononucleotide transporter
MAAKPYDSFVMTLLTGAVSALGVGAAMSGVATWLEAISFVTGAICVWLTVKQNVWNFPLGLLNVATFCVVFFRSHLFADAGLQIVYFVLGAIGWWMWIYGGKNRSPLKVSRTPWQEFVVLLALTVAGTIGMWRWLSDWGGPASLWDALTTSISLASQWLLNRKRIESWVGWILVDIVYVPLYLYKELYLTAILYAVFLVMAMMGLRAWRQSWLADCFIVSTGQMAGASTP